MKDNFLKYKKIGLMSILAIVVIVSVIFYNAKGFKQLNKNNTESIFVDDDNLVFENGKEDKLPSQDSVNMSKQMESKLEDKTIVVEIKGQVKKPDVYTIDENSIINDLIDLAGGVTENADLSNINRAKKLQNHEMIYIADKNDINNDYTQATNMDNEILVDINTATTDKLKTLNGIGDSKAKSIIEYREQNGGFKSIEEIKNVTGIGDKMFEKIKESITV
ncbi:MULTISPECIES: helix-hairpin-helix domain-containing protein [Clostridium]|uniref:helix-hairpin-helix domain-containing protein n=1 Tax=Clostridium TaxID=1485 RepID=UPI0008A41347|nr:MULTISPECIES: helix-hairpin-helix domain-containing protein [Clostridium]OFS19389.1 competence protein ComEA [Clostridium sp. HMSC19A10]